MTPEESDPAPRRFYHGRAIGLVLGLSFFAMVVVDLLFDHQLSWWTVGKALGASVLILGYLYLVRFPKMGGR
jgi:hypothetical protein